jgi:hypothetical protein
MKDLQAEEIVYIEEIAEKPSRHVAAPSDRHHDIRLVARFLDASSKGPAPFNNLIPTDKLGVNFGHSPLYRLEIPL